MRLIRRNGEFPSGGFPFKDAKTGEKYNGMDVTFDQQVTRIVRGRMKNPNLYPTAEGKWFDTEIVSIELEEYTCQRLGNPPRYCTDGKRAGVVPNPTRRKAPEQPPPNCPACNSLMLPVYCPTCSRQKLIGWKCPKCKSQAQA